MEGWHLSRVQLGIVLMTAGLAFLVAIPGTYWAVEAHHSSDRAWWWPTWWMMAPLIVFVIGGILMVIERHSPPDATTGRAAVASAAATARTNCGTDAWRQRQLHTA